MIQRQIAALVSFRIWLQNCDGFWTPSIGPKCLSLLVLVCTLEEEGCDVRQPGAILVCPFSSHHRNIGNPVLYFLSCIAQPHPTSILNPSCHANALLSDLHPPPSSHFPRVSFHSPSIT